METKTAKAVTLYQQGNLKEAMKIFKTFRIGFTKEEKRTIEIATEVLTGNEQFYIQLGVDTQGELTKAKTLIKDKYFV